MADTMRPPTDEERQQAESLYDAACLLGNELAELVERVIAVPPTIELALFAGALASASTILAGIKQAGAPLREGGK